LEPEAVRVEVIKPEGGVEEIEVQRSEWEILRYKMKLDDPNQIETEVLGTFEQYPLRLAWAITIHKAQGKTFDRVVIDLGRGAFAHEPDLRSAEPLPHAGRHRLERTTAPPGRVGRRSRGRILRRASVKMLLQIALVFLNCP
ncbi:helicase C-terminal domain-containing protein, partial [Arthrospira platensis SPKY1]|nr:helicase C-terminal domain-containing protein [Arthrospira platensis SPKY1]